MGNAHPSPNRTLNIGTYITIIIILIILLAAMKNLTQYRELLKFPTDEDLTGAATALIRLQDTYKLDTASVARGELNGIQYSTQLSGK